MKEIYTEIEINAPASVVWSILTDFDDFSRWNPFIRKISGKLQEGAQIEVFIIPPNSNGMKFRPKILTYDPEKELRWLGNFWIPKLFDGEHSLVINEISENKVLFIQKERFSGLFVPFFSGTLKNTESGFEMMNHALKEEAESKYNK
ncbi:SRPBCC domain-containing protein [Methanobacterium sp.]|uniref:SRPBCC domain-containing protein n=1 Tax=Methanobacterium sp. TaxID=2164 RepID=UPI0031598191